MTSNDKIWSLAFSLDEVNDRGKDTMVEFLGIEFIRFGDDFLVARMPVDARTKQPLGLLHGGASVALAETVGSTAANLCVDFPTSFCVGMEINANHVRSATEGFVEGTARPIHLGRSSQVWEIRIVDDNKRLISICRLTMAVVSGAEKTSG